MIAATTAAGQFAAEALMGDEFTAYSEGTVTIDGLDEPGWVAEYVTVGRVVGQSRQSDAESRTVTVGGVEREVLQGGLHIPLAADLPAIGWVFVCTAVGSGSDPALLGRKWRVQDVPVKSYATARRLDVYALDHAEGPA
jgi:hypothetical protein